MKRTYQEQGEFEALPTGIKSHVKKPLDLNVKKAVPGNYLKNGSIRDTELSLQGSGKDYPRGSSRSRKSRGNLCGVSCRQIELLNFSLKHGDIRFQGLFFIYLFVLSFPMR